MDFAGGEAEGYEGFGGVDGLGKEVGGERVGAECVEHLWGMWDAVIWEAKGLIPTREIARFMRSHVTYTTSRECLGVGLETILEQSSRRKLRRVLIGLTIYYLVLIVAYNG